MHTHCQTTAIFNHTGFCNFKLQETIKRVLYFEAPKLTAASAGWRKRNKAALSSKMWENYVSYLALSEFEMWRSLDSVSWRETCVEVLIISFQALWWPASDFQFKFPLSVFQIHPLTSCFVNIKTTCQKHVSVLFEININQVDTICKDVIQYSGCTDETPTVQWTQYILYY